MNFATRLTMQGLIRALQGKAHDIAERIEREQAVPVELKPLLRKPPARPTGATHGQHIS